jgi:hypothetical protein
VPARDTGPFADLAAQHIEATLGVQVERWDRAGRQGGHDLRYEHRSRSVAVEVKCVLDEDYRQLQGEIDKKEYRPYERLSRLWVVRLGHGAQIKSVRHELPDPLVLLDEIGWDGRLWQLGRELPGVAARLQALGIGGLIPLWSDRGVHPPGYVLHHEGWWSFGADVIDEPAGFACAYLAGAGGEVVTLRRQLRDAQADERHVFPVHRPGARRGSAAEEVGTRGRRDDAANHEPTLPEPVDGLWLAGWSSTSRVIGWLPYLGWIEGRTGPGASVVAMTTDPDDDRLFTSAEKRAYNPLRCPDCGRRSLYDDFAPAGGVVEDPAPRFLVAVACAATRAVRPTRMPTGGSRGEMAPLAVVGWGCRLMRSEHPGPGAAFGWRRARRAWPRPGRGRGGE